MLHKLALVTLLGVMASVLSFQEAYAGNGPPANAIYAHDRLYTGVNAPRDLPGSGPFNAIYPFPGTALHAVSEAAPGDRGYVGGRWEVHPVTFLTISPRQFTNAEDLLAAAARGEVGIGAVVRRFECPLIPLNVNQNQ